MTAENNAAAKANTVFPNLRDPSWGWIHFSPLVYAFLANMFGVAILARYSNRSTLYPLVATLVITHGRVLSAYMVHEATHGNIFKDHWANHWFGVLALWCAGCPYCDFRHVRIMHIKHHKDRADVVEFDYRAFISNTSVAVRHTILCLEFFCIPVVETIHHLRSALYPLFYPVPTSRRQSSALGVSASLMLYTILYLQTPIALAWYFSSGILMLNFLAFNDAFHHTYEAVLMEDYIPGPGNRTAQYEEENTFSNLVTENPNYQWLNGLFTLNFGYHNAHHVKPMTPWYGLPTLHRTVYSDEDTPQVLPFGDLLYPWWKHRLERVVNEDYGVVKPLGTPHRARNFVGALGVSFLTV